jgi:cleavage stimulation factor subunit 3
MANLLRDTPVPEYHVWKNSRQATDYSNQYGGYQNRDSPAPVGRPLSPYVSGDGPRGRMPPSSAAQYGQSTIRPGSSGSYEPSPAAYSQGPPPPQTGYAHPPPTQYDGGSGAAWAPYPPPPMAQLGYGGPPPPQLVYGQGPPPAQGGYPRYPPLSY